MPGEQVSDLPLSNGWSKPTVGRSAWIMPPMAEASFASSCRSSGKRQRPDGRFAGKKISHLTAFGANPEFPHFHPGAYGAGVVTSKLACAKAAVRQLTGRTQSFAPYAPKVPGKSDPRVRSGRINGHRAECARIPLPPLDPGPGVVAGSRCPHGPRQKRALGYRPCRWP